MSATIPITKPIICPPDEKIITLAFVSSQLLIENKYKKRNTPVSESKNTEVNLVVLYQKDILLYKWGANAHGFIGSFSLYLWSKYEVLWF